jgi:hypothetical protein
LQELTDIFDSHGGVNAQDLVPLSTLVKEVGKVLNVSGAVKSMIYGSYHPRKDGISDKTVDQHV